MAKYLKKSIEKVNSTAESYVDLSDFKEAAPDKQRTGCMSVVCTSGSKRLKLNHDLYAVLNEPSSVRVLLGKSKIAIVAVPDGTAGSFKLGKGGILYDTAVVDEVISLTSGIDFPENASTRCSNLMDIAVNGDGTKSIIDKIKRLDKRIAKIDRRISEYEATKKVFKAEDIDRIRDRFTKYVMENRNENVLGFLEDTVDRIEVDDTVRVHLKKNIRVERETKKGFRKERSI